MVEAAGVFVTEAILFSVVGDAATAQSAWEPIFFAVFGGLAINGLNLLEALSLKAATPERSPNITDPVYWVLFVFKLFIAAGLAFAYVRSNQPLTPIVAINVGASAPAILRALASALPTVR